MKYLQIVSDSTNEVVRQYDVTNKNARQLEKFEKSVLLRIDLSNYHTQVVWLNQNKPK